MQNDILDRLTRLPDAKLVEEVKALIGRERGVTAEARRGGGGGARAPGAAGRAGQ
jgi:hypothetical protein